MSKAVSNDFAGKLHDRLKEMWMIEQAEVMKAEEEGYFGSHARSHQRDTFGFKKGKLLFTQHQQGSLL